MYLVHGAKRVVVLMDHVSKNGAPKILKQCSLPLTGQRVVDRIITDLGVIDVTNEGLVLRECAPGLDAKHIQNKTEAELLVGPDLKEMAL